MQPPTVEEERIQNVTSNSNENHNSELWNPIVKVVGWAIFSLFASWQFCVATIDREHQWGTFLQIAPNVMIVIAMGYHAYIYNRQWQAMQAALKQNQEIFELTERPSLGVDFPLTVWPKDGNDLTQGFDVRVPIKNYGRSPAVQGNASLVIGFPLAADVPTHACPEPTFAGGDRWQSRIVIPAGAALFLEGFLTRDEFDEIQSAQLIFFIWVILKYWGSNTRKEPYTFEYYARLNAKSGNYEICQDHNDAN